MYSFSYLERVGCSICSSNCCFLTCIQFSQEAGQVWYSHFFQNFPQFIVIHTIKGFGIVNKPEIDVFRNSLAFSMIQWMLAILPLVPLCFLHPAWTSGSSRFTENFEHYLTSMWDECNCVVVWAFFGIAFLGIEMKTDVFHSCGHCWVFQICWHFECSPFTASSFRIWNNSTGIPSPPLALFVVMLPKAHLTSHSRMSGSTWVITPLWLSGSWRSDRMWSTGEGNGKPLQYSFLDNFMDRGVWQITVHGVTTSRKWLSD